MKVYDTIQDYLNWWISGLLIPLPIALREKIRYTPNRLLLEFDKGALTLKLHHGVSNQLLQTKRLEKDDKLEFFAVQEWLNDLRDKDTDIILLLPEDEILVKTLTLPASAKDNLREILGFEMDRQTPFTANQVYFDYLQLASAPGNEKLQLELFVVPQKTVDDYLSDLKDWQIQAQRVTLLRNNYLLKQLNFLPAHLQDPATRKTNKLTRLLTVCCFLLFIAALYLPLSDQEQSLTNLEKEVNKSRIQAKELLSLTAEKNNILFRSRFLIEKQNNRIPVIVIVNELTRILPDDTWLNRLVIRDNKMELQGESDNATAIIQLVESSDYFHDAQFRSPITRNNATGKDRFNVSTVMEKGVKT